jgi:hypothetical protein
MSVRLLAALAALISLGAATLSAQPVTVEGVSFPPTQSVGGQSLVLNGAGVRTRLLFKVYAAGLYVPARSADAAVLLAETGARRVSITMLRDVDAETFAGALVDGLKANHTDAQLATMQPQIDRLQSVFKSVGEAKKGSAIGVEYAPDTGTRIVVDGQPRGEPIPGGAFFAALLRVWIGDKPADASLKKAMLGG